MKSGHRLALMFLASTLLLTSCHRGPGPIQISELLLSNCTPVAMDESILIGRTVIGPEEPATLEDIVFNEPTGVEIVESFAVPAAEGTILSSSYPPVDYSPLDSRTPLEGAVLEPDTEYTIVLRVQRTADIDASARGLTLTYQTGGHTYTASTDTEYEFRTSCNNPQE